MSQVIKVEMVPRPSLLDTQPGDELGTLPIVQTIPGGVHATVAVPDDWSQAAIDRWARTLERAGILRDDGNGLWRFEKQLTILGWPVFVPEGIHPEWVEGDTFLGIGIYAETQVRGNLGKGVKVALLDTGLDGSHPWFAKMLADGRLIGDLADSHGHGTHTGGTITGDYGIAPGATLRVWNVLPGGSGSESGIAAGIDAATDWGAQVLSMSLGGAGGSQLIDQSVNRAKARGVLVSSAAGNGSSEKPVGSPARVSTWSVMAYDRADPPGWASFTDGRNPADTNLPAVARPGLQVVSAKPGGGTQPMSGTSMACPHQAGFAVLLLGAVLSAHDVELYTASHMGIAPDGKTAKMLLDFGAAVPPPIPPPPPEPPVDPDRVYVLTQLRAAIDDVDTARYVLRKTDPEAAWTYVGEASRKMGLGADRLAGTPAPPPPTPPPPSPPPPPPPAPPVIKIGCVHGTYPGHGRARDAYAGLTEAQIQWGPHHGIPLLAPADGRIELYAVGTPLSRAKGWDALGVDVTALAVANWHALFDEWICWVGPEQTMYVAVWWPSGLYIIEQQLIGHLHYGHLRSDIRIGAIRKGERFAVSWDSGVHFEPQVPNARASHTHCCAGVGTQLSPNGDLPGELAIVAQGWTPMTDIGTVPGPNEYFSGRYCAGRLLSDFQQAKQPIPPVPS